MIKNDDRVAVVLGGTVPHGELIKQLKKRGYKTVLIDYFNNPPAALYADVHMKDSAMDYDAVVRIAKDYKAGLILSSCLDQQINIAIRASEELGLKHPFSSDTAQKVTNKEVMKKIMAENGIPTSRYIIVDSTDQCIDLKLNYPLVVKPSDGCGSAGVNSIYSDEHNKLENAVCRAAEQGSSGSVIIEELIEGTEMGVHGYIDDGKFVFLLGTCKITTMFNGILMQLCNVYIPSLRNSLYVKLKAIANKIVETFELPRFSPFFMQCIVKGEDVYVIEFAPRVAGGTSSEVAKTYAGVDLISYSIDSYLGEYHAPKGHQLEKCVCCLPIYADEGVFDYVMGVEGLRNSNTICHEILLKSTGDSIDWRKPSNANVMKYVIESDDFDECYRKIEKAYMATDIIDKNGKSMKRGNAGAFHLTHGLFWKQLRELI